MSGLRAGLVGRARAGPGAGAARAGKGVISAPGPGRVPRAPQVFGTQGPGCLAPLPTSLEGPPQKLGPPGAAQGRADWALFPASPWRCGDQPAPVGPRPRAWSRRRAPRYARLVRWGHRVQPCPPRGAGRSPQAATLLCGPGWIRTSSRRKLGGAPSG